MIQPKWWSVLEAVVATLGSLAFLSSYVAIPLMAARRRRQERGTPTRSTLKLAFMFTLVGGTIWWAIPLVPSLFLNNVAWGAIDMALVLLWAAITIPVGVWLITRLMAPLSDADIGRFMNFGQRPRPS